MQTPVARKAVRVIIREHQQLSMVVTGMQRFVKLLGAGADVARPPMFRSMLFYISEYPEQLHHPKEERYLFARLRHHANDLDKTIDELEVPIHARPVSLLSGQSAPAYSASAVFAGSAGMGQQRLSLNGVKGRHFDREPVLKNARKHVCPHSAQTLRPGVSPSR